MLALGNLVHETNSATGTANFVLTGAVSGRRTFALALGSGTRLTRYIAKPPTTAEFEVGIGLFNGTTGITRLAAAVQDGSSGAGALTNFSAAPEIYIDMPAQELNFVGIDKRNISEYFEDFISGTNGTKFTQFASGTGSGWSASMQTTGVLGGVQVSTGTTSTGVCMEVLNSSNSAADYLFNPTKALFVAELLVKVPTLSDGGVTDAFDARLGFGNTLGADPQCGVWFQCGTAIDVAGYTGRWALNSLNFGSKTGPVDSGVAVDTANYQRLRIELAQPFGLAMFFIDGVNVGSISTNLPDGNGSTRNIGFGFGITKTLGTTARTYIVDYAYLGIVPTAARN